MYAKKSLGQHFLKSERALNAIVATGEVKPDDIVLEIGPGTGSLTEKLLQTGAKVIAVEKDDNLYENLKIKFQNENLELINDDILKLIENSKLKIKNYKLISNIPYNITGAILEKFLSARDQPELMVLLVQREVAKRIVDEKESILSISVKSYGEPEYIERVLAGSFAPKPKVDSAIILIKNISKKFFSKFSETDFFKLLKAGFKSKRKKLSSNLSALAGKEKTLEAFKKLGLSENARAEELSIDQWGKLAELICR
ncbi:MAG: ribosomal RNA small subunit methyltransferase A [Candidatus Zambryskibacteria bacterium RIFCSPHIGHO2_01_FULL_49_18]|uniref:Ribosomal RNA small subunit methyltransferase A n=2 Tax=Candidatus Zambryskiibacteriota TaxID=1817925 RepID=A0A1G2T2S9_9BACT|nr:MAG: ribosomal RNA small subunit methyltransferase A [Candidatus Zambryskibacteria bacterium RIFCSPHIGHO2_01_FULL_49_18]OHB05927.1 MAG: ribosomal RNA small subunit methyltransferase A [Candidatus Zambryskibacteria bacterium RIFCSPLOWO2_01_FULL_47_14]